MMKSLKMMKNRFNSALPFAKRWWALAFREMEKERDRQLVHLHMARARRSTLRNDVDIDVEKELIASLRLPKWYFCTCTLDSQVLMRHQSGCCCYKCLQNIDVKENLQKSFLEFFFFFESSQFQWINNVRMWWILRCRDEGSVCWPTFIDVRGTMISGKGTAWCFHVCVHLMLLLTLLRWFTIHGD